MIKTKIKNAVAESLEVLYNLQISSDSIELQPTKKYLR